MLSLACETHVPHFESSRREENKKLVLVERESRRIFIKKIKKTAWDE